MRRPTTLSQGSNRRPAGRDDSIRTERAAFTLAELLVTITIIALLLSMLLPAIRRSREAASTVTCKNNLKQLTLAMHSYYGLYGTFPPGCFGKTPEGAGWGWIVALLPQLDQGPLHRRLNPQLVDIESSLSTDLQEDLVVNRCRADPVRHLNDDRTLPNHGSGAAVRVGVSSYVLCNSHGALQTGLPDPSTGRETALSVTGVFFCNSNSRMRDIPDGASNTLMVGERASLYVADGRTYQGNAGLWSGTAQMNTERLADVLATTRGPLNPRDPELATECFSSNHTGGAQFGLCDGSVRFIRETVESRQSDQLSELGVYQRLAHKRDGQILGGF